MLCCMSHRQNTLKLIETVQSCLHNFSTSSHSFNSGKFRKLKPVASSFLSREPIKQNKKYSNPFFHPDYLDKLVDKLLQSNRRRYHYLTRQPPNDGLEPDSADPRENVVEDWNHINETVMSLGTPEVADVIGGQMFAGGHLRSTTTSCLTLRLADNVVRLTDRELQHLIHCIYCWPGDAGGSESLLRLVSALDNECSRRCENWQLLHNLHNSLIWTRFAFRPEKCQFAWQVLEMSSSKIHETCLESLLPYLLLVSYLSHTTLSLKMDDALLRVIEEKLLKECWEKMDQTEVAMAYSALDLLFNNTESSPVKLKQKIQETYGFRL